MIKWLIGDLGTPGEYMYGPIHLYSTAAVVLAVILVVLFCRHNRKSSANCRKLLVGVSVFQLGFEILWRLIYWLVRGDSILCWWPMYPCNLGGILIPVIALLDLRRGKQLFYLFGFVGGVLTFAMPDGIFCRDVLVFPILKSILQHTGLLLIPAIEYTSGSYRPSLGDYGWVVGGCSIHLVNCEVIDRLLGYHGDYMFLRSGLPFVIPGVPRWITMSVFALLVLAFLSFLCDVPGSLGWIKGLGKQKTRSTKKHS